MSTTIPTYSAAFETFYNNVLKEDDDPNSIHNREPRYDQEIAATKKEMFEKWNKDTWTPEFGGGGRRRRHRRNTKMSKRHTRRHRSTKSRKTRSMKHPRTHSRKHRSHTRKH